MKRELTSIFTRVKMSAKASLAAGFLLLAGAAFVPIAQAQIDLNPARPSTISGTVFVEAAGQPAARIKVDVRAIAGGNLTTTYTDSGGRFHAQGPGAGSYIVSVAEPGYEPVEERVDQNGAASVVLTLRKTRATPTAAEGYTVNVHDLNVPGKARKEFEKGVERLQKRDAEGSIAHFKEATNAFPDYYEAFYQLGVANLELRRGDEAELALQKAIDLSGGHSADPQFALGALLCDRGAYADAEKVIRKGLENDTVSGRGYLFLGQAQFGLNRIEEAEKSARKALSRKADLASAYIVLANVNIRRQDYRGAIRELDNFLRLKPEGPTSDQARDVRNAAERVVNRFMRMFSTPQFVY